MTGNTEREAIRNAVGTVLTNAMNFPEKVQSRLLGQDMGPLIERVTDAASDVWRNRQTGGDRDLALRLFQENYRLATRPVITDEAVTKMARAFYAESCASADEEPHWDDEAQPIRGYFANIARAALESVFGETHQPSEGQENR